MTTRFKAEHMTNVRVGFTSLASVSIACDYDGAQYHVWLNPDSQDAKQPLYKNPLRSVPDRSPGDFPTRKLSITSSFGLALIGAMLHKMKAEGLYDAALIEYRQKERDEEHEQHMAALFHIVISIRSPLGRVMFVTDANDLSEDIRDACLFAHPHGESQADSIASHEEGTPFPPTTPLAVISLTRGELARFGVTCVK